jgi:Cdc6-like AAA superfamily ATPase
MKIERKSSTPKANRIFANREQQLEIFWNQYKTCQESMKTGDPDISVLMYYGIGGIGKSALIEKIISEMKEKLSNPQYVYYDFNVKQDKRSVLKSLRNHLVNDYKFSFPLFDLALYNYAQKNGEDIASSEIQHFINSSVF